MRLNPYLNFDGSCEEAMGTYAKIPDGEIVAMLRFGEMPGNDACAPDLAEKIAHARLVVGDDTIMASDTPSNYTPMQGVSITLNIPEPAKAETVFHALAEGGQTIMPLEETFWALKFGMLVDRFGTRWMVNCEKPK